MLGGCEVVAVCVVCGVVCVVCGVVCVVCGVCGVLCVAWFEMGAC